MKTIEVIDGAYTGLEITGLAAKRQHIEHSFKVAKNVFEVDMDAGFDWYSILGVMGIDEQDIKTIFRRHLEKLQIVKYVKQLDIISNDANRKGTAKFEVVCIDGETVQGVI